MMYIGDGVATMHVASIMHDHPNLILYTHTP